jgi:NAD(P)-dependent dehydrogenase (short-subunit alcohol dehydrogenase family)
MDCVAHAPPTQLGIRVNAVRPEIFATRRPQRMARPNRAEQIAPQLPMRRAGSAEEVGEAIVWLPSQRWSFTTGPSSR